MPRRISRWSVDLLLIALVSFITYITVPVPTIQAQACPRLQARCSFRVETWGCSRSTCATDTCGNYNCCYIEAGPCINLPEDNGYSQICGGLCGGISGP